MSRPRRLGKAGRRWLLLFHRWAGISAGLFFALWIGSGLVMLYVPFPALTDAERLSRLGPIAWDQVMVSPDDALRAGDLGGVPAAFGLEMRGGEPVYRIADRDGARATVSARTGARLGPPTPEDARRLAAEGAPDARVEPVDRDQWTVTARYDPLRPFLKVALGDPAGTELYVSQVTGEIVLDTTRSERGWNWVGAVAHWIYLTPLRARPELWRAVLLWLSGFAALGALSGLAIGIWRLRLRRRYAGGAVTPYRGPRPLAPPVRPRRRDRAQHLHPQRLDLDEPEPLVLVERRARHPPRRLCRAASGPRPHRRGPARLRRARDAGAALRRHRRIVVGRRRQSGRRPSAPRG
ncbi:hypothetical protein ACU4GA_21365 [Methylobacterium oryzae CBMB20]